MKGPDEVAEDEFERLVAGFDQKLGDYIQIKFHYKMMLLLRCDAFLLV
jgi:hypothetical protein